MPMDGLTLGFMARELKETLNGGRVEKVNQPEKDMLVLALRNNGANYKLLLSASPSFARVHLTEGQFVNPLEPPMFCMLLRKHLTGGRVLAISALRGDRVLRLDLEAQDELDLHEMLLDDAVVAARLFLDRCWGRGLRKVRIITGKGIHSKNGEAVIRPAVTEVCRNHPKVREVLVPKAAEGGSGALTVILKARQG